MPAMHASRRASPVGIAAIGATALALLAAGCGGDSGDTTSDQAAPPASDFPSAQGQTLQDLYRQTQPDQNVVVAPTGRVFEVGTDRFGFGVFDASQKPITDAQVALYVAPHGGGNAS